MYNISDKDITNSLIHAAKNLKNKMRLVYDVYQASTSYSLIHYLIRE